MSDPELAYHILAVLFDDPRHADDVIFEVAKRRGTFAPTGAVRALLTVLEDGAFVTGKVVGEQRIFTIAPRGSAYLAWFAERIDA